MKILTNRQYQEALDEAWFTGYKKGYLKALREWGLDSKPSKAVRKQL